MPEDKAALAQEFLGQAQELVRNINQFSRLAEAFLQTDYACDLKAPHPRNGRLHAFGTILCADAVNSLRLTRIPNAVEDINSVNRLSKALADQPNIVSALLTESLCERAFPITQALINSGQVTVDNLRALSETLPVRDMRQAFMRGAIRECSMVLARYDGLRTGQYTQDYRDQMARLRQRFSDRSEFDRFVGAASDCFYTSRLAGPLRDREEQVYAENVAQAVEDAAIPDYKEIKTDKPDSAGPGQRRNPYIGRIRHAAVVETRLRIERLGLRLEDYRVTNGHYPSSLRELPSPSGESEYLDPFSNNDYLYSVTKDGFLLYSVGLDHKDDTANTATPGGDDIVWRIGK
jgi:hypothetical protein